LLPEKPHGAPIRVFLSGTYSANEKPKSDFELAAGGQTLLFVSIPRLVVPVDRLVFGTFFVRPINLGSHSMTDAKLTTAYSDDLWAPVLEIGDQGSLVSIRGPYDSKADIQHVGDRWFVTRALPRLDPMTAAPLPVSFLLEMHRASPTGEVNKEEAGKLEITFSGPDSVPLRHTIDIRCIAAGSADEFMALSKHLASDLRSQGYPDIPVVLAETSAETLFPNQTKPSIIHAAVDDFLTIEGHTTLNSY
jgi:hypothetical protein